MISNDHDLAGTRNRVTKLERLLEELRKTARPEEWQALSSGYRLEIERMQGEILDYLVREEPRSGSAAHAGQGATRYDVPRVPPHARQTRKARRKARR